MVMLPRDYKQHTTKLISFILLTLLSSPSTPYSWEEEEPNNFYTYLNFGAGEDCVEIRPEEGFQWNDKMCNTEQT